jgi:magnesium transporter
VKIRLRRPRDLARTLRTLARARPEDVEEYLEDHVEEWTALAEATPGDAADILEALDEETAGELIGELEPQEAADVLEELRDDLAADILLEMTAEAAAQVLDEMLPEEAVDILAELDPDEAEPLLILMSDAAEAEVRRLLAYAPDSAGGLMTTDIAALPIGLTAGEAIERLRVLHEELEDLSYVYIVDELGRLEGVLSFRDLVFNRPGVGLDEVMVRNPSSVSTDTDREEVAEIIQRYHLFGLPVIDDEGRLVGMVTTEAVIESVQQEASEDFAAAMGAGIEETVFSPVSRSIRARLSWIVFDVLISSLVVVSITRFEDTLNKFTVLAALMPLIARVGGDAGSQSLAVVIRTLATYDLRGAVAMRVLRREVTIGLVNGVAIGLLSGAVGYTLQIVGNGVEPVRIGMIMTIAALANLTMAGLAGAGIPLLLEKLGLDPALGSNLLLTTVTDLIGFAGFLAVATAFL